MPDAEPLPLLPRLPLRTMEQLMQCAGEIHSDRCSWMGYDSPRPCTCGVSKLPVRLATKHEDSSKTLASEPGDT